MYQETQAEKDQREARKQALVAMRSVMKAMGYVVVQEWRESHGDGGTETYQLAAEPFRREGSLKVVSYSRRGELVAFYDGESAEKKDYLLAQEIEERGTARSCDVTKVGSRATSPCATAGYQDYRETGLFIGTARRYYRIFSAAGHGAYAYRIKEEEAGKPWTD